MGKRIHNFESAKQYFEDHNCILVSDSYNHCDAHLEYICECGNSSSITYNEFRHGKRCQKCKFNKISQKGRIPYQQAFDRCAQQGFTLLTTREEYESWDRIDGKNIQVKCKNNHIMTKKAKTVIGKKRESCLLCYRGENHHFYIDGRGFDPGKNRHGDTCNLYRPWKREVHKRDGYKCVLCSTKTSRVLRAHHLNGWKWDVENRYNVDNGITLCYEHHENFHKIYGQSNNTKEQFDQYRAIIEECQPILAGQIGIPLLILSLN